MARGQLWSAYGALEDLRLTCVNMARLRQDFSAKAEGYEYYVGKSHTLRLAKILAH